MILSKGDTFLIPPADGADFLAAFVASCLSEKMKSARVDGHLKKITCENPPLTGLTFLELFRQCFSVPSVSFLPLFSVCDEIYPQLFWRPFSNDG